MIDVQMRAEHVVDALEADAEGEQLLAPSLLAGKVERWRVPLVLAGACFDEYRVPRRSHHEGLIRHYHHAWCGVGRHRLPPRQMPPEDGSVGRPKSVLRTWPRAPVLAHRVDGDVADPDLAHPLLPSVGRRA